MHAMQAIPLFAVLLPARISHNVRYVLIGVFSPRMPRSVGLHFIKRCRASLLSAEALRARAVTDLLSPFEQNRKS